jgi:hypothetical protein
VGSNPTGCTFAVLLPFCLVLADEDGCGGGQGRVYNLW